MHDRKLLSDDNELDGAELSGQAISAISEQPTGTSFWAVIGFCVTGLVGSMFLPPSYLLIEQTATLLS